jgi:hypothetical protein
MVRSSQTCTTLAKTPRVNIYSTLKLNLYPQVVMALEVYHGSREQGTMALPAAGLY